MATYSWIGGSGVFTTPANWLVDGAQPSTAPGPADVAVIAAPGIYTISLTSAAVASLTISDPGATLVASTSLDIAGNLALAGTLRIATGGRLTQGATDNLNVPTTSFASTGTLQIVSGAAGTLTDTMSTALLGTIVNAGSLTFYGTLDNTGTTLLPSSVGNAFLASTIIGGTLDNSSDTFNFGSMFGGGARLVGTTFFGPANLPWPSAIAGGITLLGDGGSGTGTLNLGANLTIAGTPTIDNATISFVSGAMSFGGLTVTDALTLGPGTVLNSQDPTLGPINGTIGGGALVNHGTINVRQQFGAIGASFLNDGLVATGTYHAGFGMLSGPAPGITTFNTADGVVTNNGIILSGGGNVIFRGSVAGDGTIAVSANGAINGSIEMAGFYDRQLFAFLDDSASILKFDAPSGYNAVLGFRPGNTIELVGTPATVSFADTTLEIRSGANVIAGFVMPDVPAGTQFLATTDANFNTYITELACFAAGTRLATATGTAAVEALRPGDLLRTAAGALAPILWIGQRTVDCRAHPRPWDSCPIRIAPHAFGPGQPSHALRLSPDHAVAFQGALIPVRYLVNGRTVVQEPPCQVTYFHVELPRHAVLLAENLACESYLDTGNRAAFATPPPAAPGDPTPCAPLILAGPTRHAARQHLLHRAAALGHRTTRDPALRLTAAGRPLNPAIDGPHWHLRLPPGAGAIRLRSRAFIPAHMRPAEDDTRPLGVALANIAVDGRPLPLDDPRLSSGWHAPEPAWRWTDGDAGIALAGAATLAFDVVMTGTYWADARTGSLSPALLETAA